ncbi:hypothetical protein H6P81_013595 [Aristolochia fimbriata]|uniref:BHLH domain-containing protein n=1 Tax=Aristolochia fimbriata TaxID=158543 RepID=A0AAV7EIE9_ARIFI|nr:hypothetical protein H6P81_013595 [Aristolochia fimbriata]
MEKEDEGYSVCPPPATNFPALDYALDPHQVHHHHQVHPQHEMTTLVENSSMVDYLLSNPPPPHASTSLDKLSFADVMQFADFGPKLALNQPRSTTISDDYNGIDPVYFHKFTVLNEKPHQDLLMTQPALSLSPENEPRLNEIASVDQRAEGGGGGEEEEEEGRESTSTRLRLLGGNEGKNSRRKRPRTVKTSEEVESQRMTHIAVERNRRKQMNEHLRVLRSLMPG